jgi:ABC-type transporter Mla subunit MlaD
MRRVALIAVALIVAAIAVAVVRGTPSSGGGHYLVRGIFDDASFAAPGEDVRIAGANVGSIQSLDVTADKKAAVTLSISDPRFTPFYANATCSIRPQSLIGEEYVDCLPGTTSARSLQRIRTGPGAGSYLLPVGQTSSPVDSDILQDISQEPVRQSLAVIIDELGTGLAARGSDLNAVIHRANPALGQTDKVFKILASQNHTLARLATDSDAVLAPLARARHQISGFITEANATSVASAARAAAISSTFHLFPSFLGQLRPLMADLGTLADQGTPLMTSLGQSASALGQQFANLTPFAAKARTALIDLGASAQKSQPALVATMPLAQRLGSLGRAGQPTASNLQKLTASLDSSGGIEQLMAVLFRGTSAANGFDSLGHYVRDEPLVSSCTSFATTQVSNCVANFASASTASVGSHAGTARASSAAQAVVAEAVQAASTGSQRSQSLKGLLGYLIGGGR